MAVTQEPRGLNWINNVNMTTFGPLISNVCWLVGSLAFTYVTCVLLLDEGLKSDAHHGIGIQLATALLFAWTGKTAAGVIDANNKRKAHPDYAPVLEAKERGKMAAATAAVVLKEQAADAKATREHAVPAVPAPAAQVNVNTAPPVAPLEVQPEPNQWANGKSDAGVI